MNFSARIFKLKCTKKEILHERIINLLRYSFLSLSSMTSEGEISTNILMPPLHVCGMKKLDRDAFKKEISVPTLILSVNKLKQCLKALKPCLLKMNNFSPVQNSDTNKIIYLNPVLFHDKILYLEDTLAKFNLGNVDWTLVTLTYDNFNHESIFKAILPIDTLGNVSSFSVIGHIIHLNLKPHLMDYKYLIGEVLLDKFSNIKTVVNKVQTIDSTYRNFEMELLAGESNYEVLVKENGFQYAFDFSKVFWNPRLVQEHSNIVKIINSGDLVFDVFAGVGPFAIPLAKKECIVFANDLNPNSYKWLCHNANLNKVSKHLTSFNMDGQEFIQTVIKDTLIKYWNDSKKINTHIIMNLPSCAIEFLCTFDGLLSNYNFTDNNMPYIYCYFFLKKDEEESDIVSKYFREEDAKDVHFFHVRAVAPNKRMMRLTYQLKPSHLFHTSHEEPIIKKIKLS